MFLFEFTMKSRTSRGGSTFENVIQMRKHSTTVCASCRLVKHQHTRKLVFHNHSCPSSLNPCYPLTTLTIQGFERKWQVDVEFQHETTHPVTTAYCIPYRSGADRMLVPGLNDDRTVDQTTSTAPKRSRTANG